MTRRTRRPPIDANRFLRRRGNLRVRRRRWTRRSLPVVVVLVLVLAGTAAFLAQARTVLSGSEWFRVQEVTFHERHRTPRDDLQKLAGTVLSQNLFAVDLGELEERIEAHPWIDAARVRRVLPDAVHVVLEERTPIAVALLPDGPALIDRHGILLGAATPADTDGRYPRLAGLGALAAADRSARVAEAAILLDSLAIRYPALLAGIDRIDVGRDDATDLVRRGTGPRLRLPAGGGLGMLPAYLGMRDRIRQRFSEPGLIDLRWREQIAVLQTDER